MKSSEKHRKDLLGLNGCAKGNFDVPEIAPVLQRNTIKHVNWEHGALHNSMLPVT